MLVIGMLRGRFRFRWYGHGVRRPCLNWHGGTPRIVVLRRLLRYRRWCGPGVDIIASIGNSHMFRVLFRRFHVVDAACDYRLRLHLLRWHSPWIVIQLRWGEKETKIVVCPSYGGMPAIYGIGCRYYGRQCR